MKVDLPRPEDTEVKISRHICEYHQQNPHKMYAGCTCMSSYSLVQKGYGDHENDKPSRK